MCKFFGIYALFLVMGIEKSRMEKEKQKGLDKYQRKCTERWRRRGYVYFAQKMYHILKNICDVIMNYINHADF